MNTQIKQNITFEHSYPFLPNLRANFPLATAPARGNLAHNIRRRTRWFLTPGEGGDPPRANLWFPQKNTKLAARVGRERRSHVHEHVSTFTVHGTCSERFSSQA